MLALLYGLATLLGMDERWPPKGGLPIGGPPLSMGIKIRGVAADEPTSEFKQKLSAGVGLVVRNNLRNYISRVFFSQYL